MVRVGGPEFSGERDLGAWSQLLHPDEVEAVEVYPGAAGLPAQVAGLAALDDQEFLAKTLRGTAEGQDGLRRGLRALGFEPLDSYTNFLAVKTAGPAACDEHCEGLMDRGVFVRPLGSFGFPELFRVTIGTSDENAAFLDALASVVGA